MFTRFIHLGAMGSLSVGCLVKVDYGTSISITFFSSYSNFVSMLSKLLHFERKKMNRKRRWCLWCDDECVELFVCEWLTLLTDNDVQFFFLWNHDFYQMNEEILFIRKTGNWLCDDDDECSNIYLSTPMHTTKNTS